MNYRLAADQLDAMLASLGTVLVVADDPLASTLADAPHRVISPAEFTSVARSGSSAADLPADGEPPAVYLFTSGTSAAPKAAVLRHRHLASYVIGTVEFASADPDEVMLVSAPPYHVAGMANLLTNLYAGRRIVYLPEFEASAWVRTVRHAGVSHAMVVPTMLARITDVLGEERAELGTDAPGLPTLRAVSYGGARTPEGVLARTMDVLGDVAFTNAYGLTETSSTIAVLGPDDHRAARDGDEAAVTRLSSVGRVVPLVELEVRGPDGPLPAGEVGEIWVRGEQVSGEYAGRDGATDDEGWFPTRDRGWLDAEDYLFVEGRSDDTIIRGGENIAPAEVEDVLCRHPEVAECAVVGIPDDEWGQRIGAAVVLRPGATADPAGLRAFARERLRGSKTPDVISIVAALPYTDTGKLLRRSVVADLTGSAG